MLNVGTISWLFLLRLTLSFFVAVCFVSSSLKGDVRGGSGYDVMSDTHLQRLALAWPCMHVALIELTYTLMAD